MSNISQKLDLRQSQNLVMTPQLQQAIKLLQLSNLELNEVIEEELEKNPLLEKAEPDPNDQPEATDTPAEKDNIEETFDNANNSEPESTQDQAPDFDAGSSMADIGSGGNSKFEDYENSFENRLESEKTLRDHLTEQLQVATDDPRDRMIGGLLIDRLDESGYLREDTDALAERLGCSEERLQNLLRTMKGFDPSGVFASDLADCMAIQLHDRGQLDGPMQALLDNLNLLAEYDHKKLAEICGCNDSYLADMITEIKALNPKPVSDFDHLVVQTAIPDVLMKRLPKNLGGGWRVELNTETLPRVLVNNEYYTEVAKTATQKKDKEYLSTQLQNANWLVRAMDQRAQTILKVAAEIIEQQDAFFNYGIEFLKP